MSEPTEREDLEQLQSCPGWLRFVAFAKQQWGPAGYGVRLKQAIAAAQAKGEDLSQAVARVDAANEEINALLTWPRRRATDLAAAEQQRTREQQVPLSRRGQL
jgi:hypothetical protein